MLEHDGTGDPTLVFAHARASGNVTVWWPAPTPTVDAAARHEEYAKGRDLFQLRRPLDPSLTASISVRPFVPGADEGAWLELNNRAFASHPEQGNWTLTDLRLREAEPWFDAAGFLLHEEGDRLAGFCWTKIHAASEPRLGEIFVIGVDPDFDGRGLGKALTMAGLAYLAGRGITVGMLYVDASNAKALAMYDHIGFVVHHVHRSYVLTPTNAPTA